MYSNAARLGDATTRGRIVSATSTMLDDNRPVALAGDQATCSECKGAFPISGTGIGMSERGLPVVVAGDLVLCGCGRNRVLPGSNAGILLESGKERVLGIPKTQVSQTAIPNNHESLAGYYDEQFKLLSSEGVLLPHVSYRIIMKSGDIYDGITNEHGLTERVRTNGKGQMVRMELYLDGHEKGDGNE